MKTKTEYLLDCLQEECAEVIQIIGKAKRFGLQDVWPNKEKNPGEYTNLERLIHELNDVYAAAEYFGDVAKVDTQPDAKLMDLKRERMDKYMKYSRSVGLLEQDNL